MKKSKLGNYLDAIKNQCWMKSKSLNLQSHIWEKSELQSEFETLIEILKLNKLNELYFSLQIQGDSYNIQQLRIIFHTIIYGRNFKYFYLHLHKFFHTDETIEIITNLLILLKKGQVKKLYLTLTENNFTNDQIKKLETQISEIDSLETLQIKNNHYNPGIAHDCLRGICQQRVQTLRLDYSQNDSVPQEFLSSIRKLSLLLNLKFLSLNLSHTNLSDFECSILADGLKTLKKLPVIDLKINSNHKIQEKGAYYLSQGIQGLTAVQEINLEFEDNQIGNIGADYIISSFQYLDNLSVLYLNIHENNGIDNEGFYQSIFKLLSIKNNIKIELYQYKSHETLKNFNQQRKLGKHPKYILFHKESAEHLKVGVGLLNRGYEIALLINHILKCLRSDLKVTNLELFLKRNNIKGGYQLFLDGLDQLVNIKSLSLDLSQNRLKLYHLTKLVDALKQHKKLSILKLKLRNNQMSSNESYQFIKYLRNLVNINQLKLNIARNHIEFSNHKFIQQDLQKIKKLVTFSF